MGDTEYWSDSIVKIVGSSLGIKVGPGVLLVVGWVAVAAFVATGVAVWALHESPGLAIAVAVLIIVAAFYVIERSFRYAEKHPIPALMGGAELLKVIEQQIGAKDKSIISEGVAQSGVQIDQDAPRDA